MGMLGEIHSKVLTQFSEGLKIVQNFRLMLLFMLEAVLSCWDGPVNGQGKNNKIIINNNKSGEVNLRL